ncbi:hypothetical protein SEA_FLAPPER_60 [Gordonia phage Flapper]|uniref:Uncharacterized protein n=1 Tax=Gordonia phage Flapper TaxID=2079415 RepID=A0A2L1IXF7_9CAUD|nr:hypothetical protein KNT82_gp60 [Gordonia phage Flapper]AVD99803.1 hypothetical protein SEA_FLAPPER_60 [Gordonia phage Flapper]
MRRLEPMELAERLVATIGSITNDYEAGKLQMGEKVHPVKRLDDDWDPETGISNENMMRLIAERLEMQGILVYFNPEVVRQNIISASERTLKQQ